MHQRLTFDSLLLIEGELLFFKKIIVPAIAAKTTIGTKTIATIAPALNPPLLFLHILLNFESHHLLLGSVGQN